jgi:hypothetical protein
MKLRYIKHTCEIIAGMVNKICANATVCSRNSEESILLLQTAWSVITSFTF